MISHLKEKLYERRAVSLNGNKDAVLFLGTERGLSVLRAIVKQNLLNIVAVCVQDSEGHGSGLLQDFITEATAVGANVLTSSKLPPNEYVDFLKQYSPALAMCVNWRRLFSEEALNIPVRGLLVAHDSLLPHLRGFAPLNHSIRNGEDKTGVTLIYANNSTDSGDVIGQKETNIDPNEYVSTVRDRVTKLTTDLITESLPRIIDGNEIGKPQDNEKATYGVRLTPEDGAIDFKAKSRQIFNIIRATSDPYPGAFAYLDSQKTKPIKIWRASLPDDSPRVADAIHGRVVEKISGKGAFVCTGDGAIFLETVQIGNKRVSADEVLNSYSKTLY